jgi:hypothetical protein
MGAGQAHRRRHIRVGIKRRRALVPVCRKAVGRRVVSYGVVPHDELGKVGVDVDRGDLRRLGRGWKYIKGRETWVWRSVTFAIRAPGDSHAWDTGRQMTRSPLWQRAGRKVLPSVVEGVVQVLGEDG